MKTVVITGSTRGIGKGLALEFLKRGHRVVINGRSEGSVANALTDLKAVSAEVSGVAGDVALPETHHKLVDHTVQLAGNIDIWINNAGIPQPYQLFIDLAPEDLQQSLNTNIYGLMLGTQIAARQMNQQGFGKIFNMEGFGSDGRMMPKLTLYGTTKSAVHYFTQSVAKEMKAGPIQVGVLNPGMVRTDFIQKPMEHALEAEKQQLAKVNKALAEDVEVVTPFLVEGVLKSTRNYDRIAYLKGFRLMKALLRMALG